MAGRKRWDRSQYPDNWEELSQAFRASKQFTCEHCGTVQGTWRTSRAGNAYRSITAAAHRYPNDTRNPHPDLLCLCERCHCIYDGHFRGIIDEGKHQALMHEILVDRYWAQETEVMSMEPWEEREESDELPVLDVPYLDAQTERVCCSCGVHDEALEYGCGRCGRPVHYREPECGVWLLDTWHDDAASENEFWCHQCWANSLP